MTAAPHRSTKAGVETPATRVRHRDPLASLVLRSTKAGVETPATPAPPVPKTPTCPPLNEGRGRDPGDTGATGTQDPDMSSAQRRPGSRPRRHALPLVAPVLADLAQRRPGSRPRRHTVSRWRRSAGSATLNEGRGRDPGDTAVAGIRVRPVGSAQRRPGSRPRRHVNAQAFAAVVWTAQRRPGSRPRRHSTASIRFTSPGPRSTKAGVETPATRLRHGGHRARCDRSTKAGVETPATPTESRRSAPIQKVAQRRPGSRPRRHLIGLPPVFKYDLRAQRRPGSRPRRHDAVRRPGSAGMYARSTKAGVETPATPVAVLPHVVCPSAALNEGRGRDPGDTTRNGGIIGFGGVRSTKAGVETPATRSIGPQPGSPRHSLNEGRGRDPGDTSSPAVG